MSYQLKQRPFRFKYSLALDSGGPSVSFAYLWGDRGNILTFPVNDDVSFDMVCSIPLFTAHHVLINGMSVDNSTSIPFNMAAILFLLPSLVTATQIRFNCQDASGLPTPYGGNYVPMTVDIW